MKTIASKLTFVFPIITIATLLQFCAPTATTSTSKSFIEEDLSVYRPDYDRVEEDAQEAGNEPESAEVEPVYVAPTGHLKAELDTVVYRIQKSRENISYVDGFSIQLYSGNNRDEANQIKARTYEVNEQLKPKVSYEQPNYKVRVGMYYSRLEANADFVSLQKHFSRAVLVPVKIKIGE